MINIASNGADLTVTFSLSIGYSYVFKTTRSCNMDSTLLRQQLSNDLHSRIEAIKKEAYNRGWKDKSSHKKKETWFSGNINNIQQ